MNNPKRTGERGPTHVHRFTIIGHLFELQFDSYVHDFITRSDSNGELEEANTG